MRVNFGPAPMDCVPSFEDDVLTMIDASRSYNAVAGGLTGPYDLKVLTMVLTGGTCEEMAYSTGMPVRKVHQCAMILRAAIATRMSGETGPQGWQ